jgi:hypothetical protein
MNKIPKMGVHMGVIGFYPLHSPPFVKVCFTFKHIFLTSWAFAFHILLQTQCSGYDKKKHLFI